MKLKNYMNVIISVIKMLKLNCNNVLLIKGQQQAMSSKVSGVEQSVEDVKGTLTEHCTHDQAVYATGLIIFTQFWN